MNKKLIFTNGCFDILHPGHLHTLGAAKAMGDILIVGLNTDASVKRLKGEMRPIKHHASRSQILAALSVVDAVVLFKDDTPLALIKKIKPHILVKGGDYKAEDVVGYDEMLSWSGEVKIVPFLEGHSSTALIEKL